MNAVLGATASLVTPVANGVTLSWLLPMTAVAGLCLAAATVSGSAATGTTVGLAAWAVVVLAAQTARGHVDAAVSEPAFQLAYPLVAAICAGVALFAVRVPKGGLS
ncbi:MAG TPA: hypothetical protein VJT49_06290 [Amycolatopsis sp.]|uniref:hypothetical protein n=1 Tax=Amycolatopsis sp. TaxID=37632 RepID=UPI002B4A82B1|nr:hypothetical protein [Amycolatopsis sp.]HKS44716.1 hypothetical protein [Amycolatopsis sp.]